MSSFLSPAVKCAAFFQKVSYPYGLNDCWQWTGSMRMNGYGAFGQSDAHRAAYKLLIGPISKGATIDHLCRNKKCVNPLHMECVSVSVNQKRRFVPRCQEGHAIVGWNLEHRHGRDTCRICHMRYSRAFMAGRTALALVSGVAR